VIIGGAISSTVVNGMTAVGAVFSISRLTKVPIGKKLKIALLVDVDWNRSTRLCTRIAKALKGARICYRSNAQSGCAARPRLLQKVLLFPMFVVSLCDRSKYSMS